MAQSGTGDLPSANGERGVPRVTIVCIFLNEERFLREAIDSVLAQDLADWELVLVDDGSADGSTGIALESAESDLRISYLAHPGNANLGMSASRNIGAAAGSGEFVTFIDADDRWPTDKLTHQLAIMDAHPEIAMTAGAIRYWDSWRGGEDRIEHCGAVRGRVTPVPEALLGVYPLGKGGAAAVSALIRRSAYEAVGGFEESFPGFYEDQAFFAKIYAHFPVLFSSALCQDYRQHDDSCCARTEAAGLYFKKRSDLLKWLEGYAANLDANWQPKLVAALHREQRRLRWRKLGQALRSLFGRA